MVNLNSLIELSKNISILYVEDDDALRDSTSVYFSKIFRNFDVAKDGLEGLELYKTKKFDLIITDLSMPRMSGIEMIKEIKKLNESQAILVTTAHSESEYLLKCIRIGVDGYIIKPFEFEQLNYELFKILDKLETYLQNEAYKNSLLQMVEQKTSDILQLTLYQNENYEKTLRSMVEMIEDRDTYTAGHSKRVAEYSVKIAKEMGCSKEDCTLLYQAGILHDIGKVATPDAVLLNPKSLNDIEYTLIQEHVEVGYKLLSNIPMFSALAEIVRSHHERCDGMGYPRGVKGEDIHPLSKIMAVADAFDAMTTNRIYKARKSIPEALAELKKHKGKQFFPEVVQSALVALKDVSIDENITQTPKTKLEEERFAYFYKDRLTNVHNQTYLEVSLIRNSYDKEFLYLNILFLKHFSAFNKKAGWSEGDKILTLVATLLNETFKENLIFRIFGDDFAILSKEAIDFEVFAQTLDRELKKISLSYTIKMFDLEKTKIDSLLQIEKLMLKV